MNKKLLQVALTTGLGLFTLDCSAQIFRLNVTDYGVDESSPFFSDFKSFVDTEIGKIEDSINKELPSAEPQRLMEGMANSSVMAGKGIGSDYASNMQVFLIGAGVGVGADMEKDSSTGSSISGVGVAPGLIVGTNLGFIGGSILGLDPKRLNIYANFMNFGYDHTFDDQASKKSSAEIDMTSLGMHLRYDWIKGSGNKLLGWGGVKLHVGYEYNKTDIEFQSKISESVNETDTDGNNIDGTITGSPTAKIAVATHSIPIEVSTDVQLLYFISLYGGLGTDFNFGQAKGNGALNADPSDVSCTNAGVGACSTNPSVSIQPEANIDSTGKVNSLLFRGFAGLQLNLPYVRIFGQVDKSLGNDLIGATAGVRFVY